MLKKLLSCWNFIVKTGRVQSLSSVVLPKQEAISNGSNKTKFYLMDPSLPNLIKEEEVPLSTSFSIDSRGDKGGGFPLGTSEQQASACKIMVNNALSYFLVSYRLADSLKKLSKWAGTNTLVIKSRAGVDLNAYYDRSSLSFFYVQDKLKNKVVYTCDSNSVVSHEFGHAFLDVLRPDFWSTQSSEVWAYHEAFGDITSLLSSLQHDELIKLAIEETKGNLLISNVLTRVAPEMGSTFFSIAKDRKGLLPNCLRDISVVYNYVLPESLPKSGPDNVLLNESHNFSRVFSGAFYEILVKVAEENVKSGKSMLDAMKISRDVCSRYLLKATVSVPSTVRLYDALARQMLLIDKSEGEKYQSILKEVFLNRKILIQKVLMMENKNISDVRKMVKSSPYELQLFNDQKVIRVVSYKSIKLSDYKMFGLSDSHLGGLMLEVPYQSAYYFDENEKLIDLVQTTKEQAVEAAFDCLEYLDSNDLIGFHDNALFEIRGGSLVRKRIVCKCGLPNYCDPNAPEFQKPWKPANNSSCCQCKGSNCLPRSCDCLGTTKKNKPKEHCYTKFKNCLSNVYSVCQSLTRK